MRSRQCTRRLKGDLKTATIYVGLVAAWQTSGSETRTPIFGGNNHKSNNTCNLHFWRQRRLDRLARLSWLGAVRLTLWSAVDWTRCFRGRGGGGGGGTVTYGTVQYGVGIPVPYFALGRDSARSLAGNINDGPSVSRDRPGVKGSILGISNCLPRYLYAS